MATATLPLAKTRTGVLYPHAQWYFLFAMATTWLGFSQSYFKVLTGEPLIHHVHGALMGGWIALLVVQPMLYQRGKLALHRTLGRWGVYGLMPAIVVVGFLMDRRMLRLHNAPPFIIDQLAFLDATALLMFPLFIVLSIVYAKDVQLHARYIVCTVLLLMPPAWARALFFVPGMHSFQVNVNTAMVLVDLVLVALMINDVRRWGRLRAAYPVALVLLTVSAVASNFAARWGWWMGLSRWMSGA